MKILNRDSPAINLDNFLIMPPTSNVAAHGNNVLHINSKNRHYSRNEAAVRFIDQDVLPDNPAIFDSDSSILRFAVDRALKYDDDAFILEFGFCTGTTLNFIAALAYNRAVYGFDSLEGLPEDWRAGFPKGTFAYKDKQRFPFVPLPNVSLIVGLIEDTLPVFVDEIVVKKQIGMIFIDSDTYSSASAIFEQLKKFIVPDKTIIILDEGYNFSSREAERDNIEWSKHEYRATQEFAKNMNYGIKYLAFNQNHQQLVLQFTKGTKSR